MFPLLSDKNPTGTKGGTIPPEIEYIRSQCVSDFLISIRFVQVIQDASWDVFMNFRKAARAANSVQAPAIFGV